MFIMTETEERFKALKFQVLFVKVKREGMYGCGVTATYYGPKFPA